MDETLPDQYTYLGAPLGDDGVTFEGIKLLHRPAAGDDANSWLTFHRKGADGAFADVTSWRRSELDSLLPFAREELVRDAFHSINSFFRAGRPFERRRDGTVVRRRWSEGLVPVYRSTAGVRYINSAFVDLDAHRVGLSPGATFGRVFDLQRARELPDVSLFVFSGRGLWCFWLLRDDDAPPLEDARELPAAVRAWPERVVAFRAIERAIVTHPELRALGADAAATDASRIMRLAGSINSAAGEPVRVLPQFVSGRLPLYTLAQLGEAFGALVPATLTKCFMPARETPRRERPKMPAKANGPRARWQAVLADIVSLVNLRGGRLREGTRHMGCCALATTLRRLGCSLHDVRTQVTALAEASGLPLAEVDDAVRCAVRYKSCSPAYGEISAWLHVTPDEAAQLAKLPAAGTQPRAPSVLTRSTKQRRAALLRYVADLGHVPTILAACAVLAASGFPVSQGTVANDFKRLRLPRADPRGRKSRTTPLL